MFQRFQDTKMQETDESQNMHFQRKEECSKSIKVELEKSNGIENIGDCTNYACTSTAINPNIPSQLPNNFLFHPSMKLYNKNCTENHPYIPHFMHPSQWAGNPGRPLVEGGVVQSKVEADLSLKSWDIPSFSSKEPTLHQNNMPSLQSTSNMLLDCSSTTQTVPRDPVCNFKCKDCHREYKTSDMLADHSCKNSVFKPFKCTVCHASFTQKSNMKTHLRTHSGEKPYTCDICDARFTQISNLRTHQKVHTGEKPFKCDYCNMCFAQMSNLKTHKLIHTGERPYKCDECNSSFIQSSHLKIHKRIHTNEKPFPCGYCDARFRQLSNLKIHEKTHTGEKPYMCDLCGSSFSQKSNLKSHRIKLHSVEYPPTSGSRQFYRQSGNSYYSKNHECRECLAKFPTAANLAIHMRIHTGEKPYVCSECGSSFAQKSNLKSHMNTHMPNKPHPCPECLLSFKQKSNLRVHIIKKHPHISVDLERPATQLSNVNEPLVQINEGDSVGASSHSNIHPNNIFANQFNLNLRGGPMAPHFYNRDAHQILDLDSRTLTVADNSSRLRMNGLENEGENSNC